MIWKWENRSFELGTCVLVLALIVSHMFLCEGVVSNVVRIYSLRGHFINFVFKMKNNFGLIWSCEILCGLLFLEIILHLTQVVLQ